MKNLKEPKRILLAVDLKAEEPHLAKAVWAALKSLLKSEASVIEPVTVLNREDAAMGQYFKNRIGGLRKAVERHLNDTLESEGLRGLAPAKVIFADGSSTQRAAAALVDYAKKSKSGLIALSSHSRKGIERFFLGSFAEALSLQSSIPFLVVNPRQRRAAERLREILFPTDFSPASKRGLELVLRAFSGAKPRILLFYRYSFPLPFMDPFFAGPLPPAVIKDDFERIKKRGESWCKELRGKGISCGFIIDRKSFSVAEGILSALKGKKVGLVAMVPTTSQWETRLLGSVTRQVLRNSPCPVWVLRLSARPETRTAVKRRTPVAARPIRPPALSPTVGP